MNSQLPPEIVPVPPQIAPVIRPRLRLVSSKPKHMQKQAMKSRKGSALLDAKWCGHTLALSHARSGDPALIGGYLGKSDVFDKAIEEFSVAYADQNDEDYAALGRAIKSGKLKAVIEEPK